MLYLPNINTISWSKTMRIKSVFGFLSLVMIWSLCLNGMGNGGGNSSNGIYMKVSGRVIRTDSLKGVEGVYIRVFDASTGESGEAISDYNGYFEIKRVPSGIYQVLVEPIHRTCPVDLILERELKSFEICIGRNITNLNIFLIKGASISGKVFGPDGITPITQGKVVVSPAFRGKLRRVDLDNEGRFQIFGLGSLNSEEFDCKLLAKAPGYANSFKLVKLIKGEQKMNVNFIVCKGDINVKGKIISLVDNQPLKNAEIHIISINRNSNKLADGFAITDDYGNYSIIGFENTGEIEVSVFHDNYQMIEVIYELKRGENVFNFEMIPKDENIKNDSQLKKNSSTQITDKTTGDDFDICECENDKLFKTYLDIICRLIKEDSNKCIKFSPTLKCLKEKCRKFSVRIICKKKCPPNQFGTVPCGTTDAMNIDINQKSEVIICFNANTECGDIHPLNTVFHELFHTCDREAEENSKMYNPCDEAITHAATGCILDDDHSRKEAKKNKVECVTVTG